MIEKVMYFKNVRNSFDDFYCVFYKSKTVRCRTYNSLPKTVKEFIKDKEQQCDNYVDSEGYTCYTFV